MLNLLDRARIGAGNGTRTTEQLVGRLQIFSRLDAKQIKKVARLFAQRSYSKDEIIIRKGDVGLGLYAIVSGKVEIFDEDDGLNVPLAVMEAGDCVGEMSLVDQKPRSANVRVVEDTECLILTRDNFDRLVRRDPRILWGIVPVIVERLRQSNKRMVELQKARGPTKAPAVREAVPRGIQAPESVPEATVSQVSQIEVRLANKEKKDDVISPFLQLSSASLMLISSVFLFSTQEALRVVTGGGSLSRRLGESETVVSSLAASVDENMSGSAQEVSRSFRDFLSSISAFLGF